MPSGSGKKSTKSAAPRQVRRFATTRWSIVLTAQRRSTPEAQEALAAVCHTYWYPLYAFIRHSGFSQDEAQDLTQAFFARLLEKDFLRGVSKEKGRFRSFLLAACKHFISNERDRARTKKRGGGAQMVSLDVALAERRYNEEPAHTLTPARLFERRWALALLECSLGQLRTEWAERPMLFERLEPLLTGEDPSVSYREIGAEFDMTEGAIKVAVHRLRRRYREIVRQEIAKSVKDDREVDEEIAHLLQVFVQEGDARQ